MLYREPAFKFGVDLLRDTRRDVDVASEDQRFVYGVVDPAAGGRASQTAFVFAIRGRAPLMMMQQQSEAAPYSLIVRLCFCEAGGGA